MTARRVYYRSHNDKTTFWGFKCFGAVSYFAKGKHFCSWQGFGIINSYFVHWRLLFVTSCTRIIIYYCNCVPIMTLEATFWIFPAAGYLSLIGQELELLSQWTFSFIHSVSKELQHYFMSFPLAPGSGSCYPRSIWPSPGDRGKIHELIMQFFWDSVYLQDNWQATRHKRETCSPHLSYLHISHV